jgi:hypothetical protein
MNRHKWLRWNAPADEGTVPDDAAGESRKHARDDTSRLHTHWTGGAKLLTGAASGGLFAALAAGPIGLFIAFAAYSSSSSKSGQAAPPPPDRSNERAAVGEFAERFVVTWLETPSGQEAQLASYVNAPGLALPQVPFTADMPAVSAIAPVGPDTWTVTVSVSVSLSGKDKGRQYFQVPVMDTSGALVAEALPAPVSAPASGQAPPLGYGNQVDLSSSVAVSASQFLTALLTGGAGGDVTRFESPGTAVSAVSPPPYSAVDVQSVLSDRDMSGAPATPAAGDEVRLLVTATATAGPRSQVMVQYALTMAARAGRWEVRSMDTTPATTSTASANKPSPSPASPTSASTQPSAN